MVPPDGLTFHIREAVELGHAQRIGHGVDVLHEDNVKDNGLIKENLTPLLKEMASKHVMVEVNLTSNDVILGIKGTDHPLAAYRAAHVPWALSTDDEGVSRIDLTHEYVRGALEQNLSYADLKQSARTALEHSFLPGESLWAAPDHFTRRKPACAAPITAAGKLSPACSKLLETSERAAQQYELERRFIAFESGTF
jgi:adenosine deaminase